MAPTRKLLTTSLLDDVRVAKLFESNGWKPLHLQQLWVHLIKKRMPSLEGLQTSVPNAVLDVLGSTPYSLYTTTVVSESTCADKSTTKLLVRLQDGHLVESVIMRYNKRASLCVSSQVGCRMACRFCSTGTMGLRGNLTSGEMIEQLMHANRITPIRNVVFMGMGEPLDNYEEVLGALRAMVDPGRFGLSPSRVTVSTVGVVPRIRSLCRDAPGICLALSLHAPNQDLRCKIVPTARAWPLPVLMNAVDEFSSTTDQPVLVEYVVIGGVNDSAEVAHELGQLLQGRKVIVNLIPYNPSTVPDKLVPPAPEDVLTFRDITKTYGLFTTIRREMGQDISGACGQLVVNFEASSEAAAGGSTCSDGGCGSGDGHVHEKPVPKPAAAPRDIEDLVGDAPKPVGLPPAKAPQSTPTTPPLPPWVSTLSWLFVVFGLLGLIVKLLWLK